VIASIDRFELVGIERKEPRGCLRYAKYCDTDVSAQAAGVAVFGLDVNGRTPSFRVCDEREP